MKKISSGMTPFYKKGFPLLWFGMLTFFIAAAIWQRGLHADSLVFIVGPCVMLVVGLVVFRKLVWDLADEVHDCGDSLLVRNGDEQERIPLSNIMNVSMSVSTNPPRLLLRLVRPGRFGSEIVFSPQAPFSFNPFAKSPIAEDLIVRVDRARRQRAD